MQRRRCVVFRPGRRSFERERPCEVAGSRVRQAESARRAVTFFAILEK